MYSESLWNELIEFARLQTLGRDHSHGLSHGIEVSEIALKYFDENYSSCPFDDQNISQSDARWIVKIAGLFHDIPDYKYSDPIETSKIIKEFFRSKNISESHIAIIMDIIDNISFSKEMKNQLQNLGPYQILRDFVSDADKKLALGEIGIRRTYAYKCHYFNLPIPDENCSIDDLTNAFVIQNIIKHWYEKLGRLVPEGFIRSVPGRKDCQIDHDIMKKWIEKWEMKLSVDDNPSDYQISLNKM